MNPRHGRTSPLTILAAPALIFTAVAFVWAFHHQLAAAVVVGGTVWLASIVGGISAATAWVEERKARGDADERCEALEAALTDALREAAHAPVPLVPFDSLSRAERVHIAADRPELHIVPPASAPTPVADESWLDESPLIRGDDGRWS